MVVLPAAAVLALVGLAYGVAEFVILAAAAGALFVAGWGSLLWQLRTGRGALVLQWGRPAAEVYVGGRAVVVLNAAAADGRGAPAFELVGLGRWLRSHPGLSAVGAVSATRPARPTRSGVRTRVRRIAGRLGFGAERRATVRVPALGPGDRWSTAVPVPTGSRGLWSIGPLELWCSDAFGLVRWRRETTGGCHVIVLPDPGAYSASQQGERRTRPLRPGPELATDSGPTGGDEFEGLRPYHRGDRLTRLHWPALARDELLSRDFVERDERRLRLQVDTRPWNIEDSVSRLAAVGIEALAASTPVELYTAQGERVLAVPGQWGRTVLLRALALVPPARTSPSLHRERPPAPAGRS